MSTVQQNAFSRYENVLVSLCNESSCPSQEISLGVVDIVSHCVVILSTLDIRIHRLVQVQCRLRGQPLPSDITPTKRSCPVLLDVKGPGKLQMCLVVVVDKFGDGRVVAAAEHARGSRLGFDCGRSSVDT